MMNFEIVKENTIALAHSLRIMRSAAQYRGISRKEIADGLRKRRAELGRKGAFEGVIGLSATAIQADEKMTNALTYYFSRQNTLERSYRRCKPVPVAVRESFCG